MVGSTNSDLVVKTPALPEAGETVEGTDFKVFLGGKGANRAVAAARFGAGVNFISTVGRDDCGKKALANFHSKELKPITFFSMITIPPAKH